MKAHVEATLQGCYSRLRLEVIAQHGVAIGIAAAIAVIELFGILMAIWLCQVKICCFLSHALYPQAITRANERLEEEVFAN